MKTMYQQKKGLMYRWKRIHLVDKCLLVMLGILMLQSALSLFLHNGNSVEGSGIDVVARTAAAGIFGYLISANFNQQRKLRIDQELSQDNIQVAPVPVKKNDPVMRIGFDTGAEGIGTPAPTLTEYTNQRGDNFCGAQVLVVAAIGLISLCIMLYYRNWGVIKTEDTASIAQLRDFVSGSVGFLISSSSNSKNKKTA